MSRTPTKITLNKKTPVPAALRAETHHLTVPESINLLDAFSDNEAKNIAELVTTVDEDIVDLTNELQLIQLSLQKAYCMKGLLQKIITPQKAAAAVTPSPAVVVTPAAEEKKE